MRVRKFTLLLQCFFFRDYSRFESPNSFFLPAFGVVCKKFRVNLFAVLTNVRTNKRNGELNIKINKQANGAHTDNSTLLLLLYCFKIKNRARECCESLES